MNYTESMKMITIILLAILTTNCVHLSPEEIKQRDESIKRYKELSFPMPGYYPQPQQPCR